jgi:hypothetical protein
MKRVIYILGACLALGGAVACGSSTTSSSSGGGGGGNTLPSGTLGGVAFTPVDGVAVSLPVRSCVFGGVNTSATAMLIAFTNVPNSCSAFQAVGACNDKANATLVSVTIEKANVLGGTASAIGPGTYVLNNGPPTPDASGYFTRTNLNYSKTNATCVDAAASVTPTSGSVTLTSVTSSQVAGSVTVAFSDGSSFSGSFDVAICGVSFNVCDAGNCTGTGTCVP